MSELRSWLPIFLVIWLSGLTMLCNAAEYFVAPAGDDTATGSIEKPFATLMRVQREVQPGDTVQIRGGTYKFTENHIAKKQRIWAFVHEIHRSGVKDKPITYRAYRDERPIFDFANIKPVGFRVTAFHTTASWIHFIGLEVIGVQVTLTGHTQSICFDNEGSHNIFERLVMHDGQAIGIYATRGSDNLFLNCDAYNNYDYTSEGGKGGNVDGFGCHPSQGSMRNVFRGCRAWFNSDDGFDCISAHEPIVFENCWAFCNGYSPKFEKRADGNGFKIGGYASLTADRLPNPIPRNVVKQCVAVRNKANGFYANHHPGGHDWLNNTGYRNGTNFNMLCRLMDNRTDVPGIGHKLRNNLAFQGKALTNLDTAKSDSQANSFDSEMKLLPEHFQSLDEAELISPRDRKGNLPKMKFLRPTKGFPGIDQGVDVGIPSQGERPDWGAFEYIDDGK